MNRALVLMALAIFLASAASAANRPVPGTTCPTFPANSWWHADISRLPVHPRSAQWMSHMSPQRRLHPDFGPSYGEQPAPYGIPIRVVAGGHPFGDLARPRVIVSNDDEHLEVRMVARHEACERRLQHHLLVAGGHYQRKRVHRGQRGAAQAARDEVGQCPVLGGVSGLLGGGGRGVFLAGEFH